MGDKEMVHFRELTSIRNLTLSASGFTVDGRSCEVTDAGLEHLKVLSKLEILELRCGLITDDGLKHLGALPNLEHLILDGTAVTYVGLKPGNFAFSKILVAQ